MNPAILPPPADGQTLDASSDAASSANRNLLNSITLEAPLLSVEFARLALRCGEDDIMKWIISGDLEWAFDFRREGSRRSHCRILTESVVVMQRRDRRISPREKAAQRLHPIRDIFEPMFPPAKSVLLSTDLARVWGCGTSHIHNLVQDGLLTVAEKHYALREAFQIPREIIFQFMKSRRIK